jgi:hypothetical protein
MAQYNNKQEPLNPLIHTRSLSCLNTSSIMGRRGNSPFITAVVWVNASSCNFLLASACLCFCAESSATRFFSSFLAALAASFLEGVEVEVVKDDDDEEEGDGG